MKSKKTKARLKYFVMQTLYKEGPKSASELSSRWNKLHRPYVTPREVSALLRSEVNYFEREGKKWHLRCLDCTFLKLKCLDDLKDPFANDLRKIVSEGMVSEFYRDTIYDIILYWLPCKVVKPRREL